MDRKSAPVSSRRLRFGLRALLVACAVLGVLFAIVGSWIQHFERQRFVVREVRKLGGDVWFSSDFNAKEGGYGRQMQPSPSPRWFPEGYGHSIEMIFIEKRDELPLRLLTEINQLPRLKVIAVSPTVDTLPAIAQLRKEHPLCKVQVIWDLDDAEIETLRSVAEFREATKGGKSLLFIDGKWSDHAQITRRIFSELAFNWQANHPMTAVRFLRVDFTDSQTELWNEGQRWQEAHQIERGGMKVMGGVGKVIWLEEGKVAKHVWSLRDITVAQALTLTAHTFEKAPNPK